MTAVDLITEKVQEQGITKSELARRVGMSGELLIRILSGKRLLMADEFTAICRELGIDTIPHHRLFTYTLDQKIVRADE
jgi:transcriptional regulator with XRE-family HTH domain